MNHLKKFNEGSKGIIAKIYGGIFNKNSTPIVNNPIILKWIVNNQIKSYEESKKNLLQNLVTEMTELFGDPNRTLRLEFMTKLWILKYKGLIFNVFTAKGKGT